MSYPTGEGYVLTKLQAIAGGAWTATNTSRGKWGILDSGKADHYAILKEGAGGSAAFISGSTKERTYRTVVQVWQSYTDDGTSATNLQAYGEAIRNQFDAYRKLGDTSGTIIDAECDEWSEVQEMWVRGGGLRWLRQDFIVRWREQVSITFAE